jgi:hypothetical protein
VQEGKASRPGAIRLLESALVLEPQRVEAILSLAPLLQKEGRAADARTLLDGALTFATGPALKRVKRKLFFLFPGFRTFWNWLRS